MTNEIKSAEVWWQAVRTLENAAAYLQEDAGMRDISWTDDLQQSCDLLSKHAQKLRIKAIKLEGR